jgi:hypothetical protein
VAFCTTCGSERPPGALYCGACGTRFADEARPETPPPPAAIDDKPFGGEMTLVAVLLTFFAPFISLIAALILRSTEERPSRRAFLKTWAIASGAWLCTGWVLFLIAFAGISSSAGG